MRNQGAKSWQQQGTPQEVKKLTLEDVVTQMAQTQANLKHLVTQNHQNNLQFQQVTTISIAKLKTQVGQLASALSERKRDEFTS